MDKLIKSIEKNLVPIAAKLNNQRHLGALRDGFIAIMPLMIIGAFAVMINSVFLDVSENGLIYAISGFSIDPDAYPAWLVFLRNLMDFVSKGSLSILGILAVSTITYSLVRTKGYNGLESVVLAIGVYFMSIGYSVSETGGTFINAGYFGSANIITAILIAFFVGEMYTFCLKKNWSIKMPEGVPPAVQRSFSALIPATIIFLIIGFIQTLLTTFEFTPMFVDSSLTWQTGTISDFIQNVIGLPLHSIAGGLGGLLFYVTGGAFLWFFGIHGPNTLAFLDTAIFTPASIQNAALIQAGIVDYAGNILDPSAYEALSPTELPTIYSKSMVDSFVFIGGVGTTMGLIIAIFVASKDKAAKKVAKYSLAPAFFNINEPLLFGLPIVFNPLLFIPFVIVQPIILLLTVLIINIGLIPMYAIPIPWTSPVGLGAFLAYGGSFSAMIWSFVCVGISAAIYYPFVVAMNREKIKEAELKEKNE